MEVSVVLQQKESVVVGGVGLARGGRSSGVQRSDLSAYQTCRTDFRCAELATHTLDAPAAGAVTDWNKWLLFGKEGGRRRGRDPATATTTFGTAPPWHLPLHHNPESNSSLPKATPLSVFLNREPAGEGEREGRRARTVSYLNNKASPFFTLRNTILEV
jgi:hypothetical protein